MGWACSMMVFYERFSGISTAVIAFAAIALLSGCTTTRSLDPCSTLEAARLSKLVALTKATLDKNQMRLSKIRGERTKEHCAGSLFSPASKSAKCERLNAQELILISESRISSERLAEINAAIAGRLHAGQHVKSCVASWLPKRTVQKAVPNIKKRTVHLKPQLKAPVKVRPSLAVEDYVVPAYSSSPIIKPETVGYTPYPMPVSNAPSHIAPVTATPPVERAYSDNTKVRVIGSSFFQDQSKPVGPQVPDHAPAP